MWTIGFALNVPDAIGSQYVGAKPRKATAAQVLQPLDCIFVPRLLNYHTLGNIKIRGEVLYAGDYTLERRDETVQDIIKRAGGITPNASMNDVQVFRKALRVGTNLLSDDPKQKGRFLIQPD